MLGVKPGRLWGIAVSTYSGANLCGSRNTARIGVTVIIRIFGKVGEGVAHARRRPFGIDRHIAGQGNGLRCFLRAFRIGIPAVEGISLTGGLRFPRCRGCYITAFDMGVFRFSTYQLPPSEYPKVMPLVARLCIIGMRMFFQAAAQYRFACRLAINGYTFLILSRLGFHIAAALGIIIQGIGITGIIHRNNQAFGIQRQLGDFFGSKAFRISGFSFGHIAIAAALSLRLFSRPAIQTFIHMLDRIRNVFRRNNHRHLIGAIRHTTEVSLNMGAIQTEDIASALENNIIIFQPRNFGGNINVNSETGFRIILDSIRCRHSKLLVINIVDLYNLGAFRHNIHIFKGADKPGEKGNARRGFAHSHVAFRHFVSQGNISRAIFERIHRDGIRLYKLQAFPLIGQSGSIIHTVYKILRRQRIFDIFIGKGTDLGFQNMGYIQLVTLGFRSGSRSGLHGGSRSGLHGGSRSGLRSGSRSRLHSGSFGRLRSGSFGYLRSRNLGRFRESFRFLRLHILRCRAFARSIRTQLICCRGNIAFAATFLHRLTGRRRCCRDIFAFGKNLDRRQGSQHRKDQQNADHAACLEP